MPSLAASVKAHLVELIDELVPPLLAQATEEGVTARSAESEVWRVVLELGRGLLVAMLSACCFARTAREVANRGWAMPNHEEPGDMPVVRVRRDRDYRAKLHTTFGRVEVPLWAVRAPQGATLNPGRAFFPHYPRMRSSDLLVEWECTLAAEHPFRRAAEALGFFTHGAADVEDTTIQRHAVAVGAGIPKAWGYQRPAKIREILETRATCDLDTGRPIVYASTDAHALSRFVDGTWSPKWKMTNGIRLWAVDKRTGRIIHLGGEYTWGDCLEVRHRFEWLDEQGILPFDGDYGEDVVAQVVLITDGLDWIQQYISTLFPEGTVHVLDAYHAVQQASEAIRAVFPGKANERRVRTWIRKARRALGFRNRRDRARQRCGPRRGRRRDRASGLDGSGERLLEEVLQPLLERAKRGRTRLRQAMAYVERNLFRLDFGALRTRGFQIGSGAMESLHRTGSQLRLKRAGCHWTAEAAQAILNLRMLQLSGRWAEYWHQPELPHLTIGHAVS